MYLGEGAGLRGGKKKKKKGWAFFLKWKTDVCLKICHPQVWNLVQNVHPRQSEVTGSCKIINHVSLIINFFYFDRVFYFKKAISSQSHMPLSLNKSRCKKWGKKNPKTNQGSKNKKPRGKNKPLLVDDTTVAPQKAKFSGSGPAAPTGAPAPLSRAGREGDGGGSSVPRPDGGKRQ